MAAAPPIADRSLDPRGGPVAPAVTRLHALGWSVGSAAFIGPTGLVRVVTGHRTDGEDPIRAGGRTDAIAWRRAVEQAEALGPHPAKG